MRADSRAGLGELTAWAVLASWARSTPGAPAVVDAETGEGLSFRDLADQANRAARGLIRLGLAAGDRVGFWCDNRLAAAVWLYAAARAGLVWAPINARFTAGEAVQQARATRVAALLVDESHASLWFGTPIRPDIPVITVGAPAGGAIGWEALLAAGHAPFEPPEPTPDAPAGLLSTSGTTGAPKGAVHSHQSLLGWCLSMVLAAAWSPMDRILLPYPLFHMGGAGFLTAAHLTGGSVYLLRRADPSSLEDALARHDITALVTVPTVLAALFRERPVASPLRPSPSLVKVATTSGPLFPAVRMAVRGAWPNAALTSLYSATEAFFTALRPEDQALHPDSVGRPVFGAEVTVRPLPDAAPQTAGVIYTRGASVFVGYDGKPPLAPGSWFTCHDVGYVDDDGFLTITDRLADLINSGGEKIASREVERVLLAHPAVHEAAVVGLPDPLWGERVHAVVSVKPGMTVDADTLRQWCRGQLAGFKVPKTIALVDDVPKTPTGKIAKARIRQEWSRGDHQGPEAS